MEQPSDVEHWELTLIGSAPVIACFAALLAAFALSVCLLRHRLSGDESEEREEEGEATHHDATMNQQRGAALYEAAAMATAPVEPSPGLSAGGGGKQLQADGVVCLRGVVSDAACDALLHAVNTQLAALLAQPGGRRVASFEAVVAAEAAAEAAAAAAEVAAEAEGDAAHGAASLVEARRAAGEKEALLGAVLCRQERYDLKLSLQEPAVLTALTEALAVAGPACAHVLGPQPELFELGALVADSGAPRQPVHPDTPWHDAAAVVSCFVALQHVEAEMGATHFLPRTHADVDSHEAYLRGQPTPWGAPRPAVPPPAGRGAWDELLQRAPCSAPLLRRGSCALFDSRILHCGSANSSGRRRVVFYFSLKARGHGNGWKGGGFVYPGTLLDELRGQYSLATDATSLVPCQDVRPCVEETRS
jgi:ectoine hydroxylase-related dioxygenase (phytanoyl-CoA dioxygenase family)